MNACMYVFKKRTLQILSARA